MIRGLPVLVYLLLLAGPTAAQTLIKPDASVMRLDEIGIYAVGYAYRGQKERAFPVGWSGFFEERTGLACQPVGEQKGRRAFLLHCPWRNGTGVSYQTFTFSLPKAKRILLRGATAMRTDIVGKSDGATFRLFANGQKLLDVHRTDAEWKPFQFNLTAYAGKTLILRFETDPGPQDDPSFDFSLWGDRALILEGYTPPSVVHPAPPPLALSRLCSTQRNGVVPPGGFTGRNSMTQAGDSVLFRYVGEDGMLEYRWQRPGTGREEALGRIELRGRLKGWAPISVRAAAGASLEWTQEAQPVSSRWERTGNGIALVRTFRVGEATVTVRIEGQIVGKSLVLDIAADRPLIRALDAGGWGPVLRRRQIPVPYYTGQIHYLPAENLFVNAYLDWTDSNASWHDGARAHYGALTDGTLNRLHERVVYTAAWHLAEALPNIPNPPSPFRREIGTRIVLDIWGGRYTDIAKDFEKLSDYGLIHCIALIHDWQRSGYDNALPAHIPAAADKGGDEGMKTLVSTGTRLGYIVALHENYVDYYPNYDFYSESDIALDSQGKRQLAWYNPGTQIQSFAVKPNAILPLAATQSPEIHRRYGTNGNYLDVHSAVPPWFHVDYRAGEEGAGMFRRVWDIHRQLWAYERTTHAGPVFGEGNNHWYWSGCLDGVEAQFGAGWPANAGLSAPLMVDFDLVKIHPLQFNHGMGYYERWWDRAAWGVIPPMVVLDQYRMQEAAFGHAGFLGAATWNVLPLAWLEHHLLSPVMERYAVARPVDIRYEVKGRWVDGTAAAKVGEWKRVRVRYDNGLTVTANSAETPLRIGNVTLPRFGWMAQGAGVTAWTALRDGVVADYAETQESIFANARRAADWNMTGLRRIRPTVAEFRQTAPREIRFTYRWIVNETLDQNYHCFVHFGRPGAGDAGEAILFQQDHALPTPTAQWPVGTTVNDGPYTLRLPDNLPDGDYAWTMGLFTPGAGRVPLEGLDDGQGRIQVGTLHVRNSGQTIAFEPEKRTGEERHALYTRHLNTAGRVLDFGAVRTDGSVLIRREGGEWVLWTMPRERDMVVELNAKRFGKPSEVRCIGGSAATVAPRLDGDWWRLPLNGARQYRWPTR